MNTTLIVITITSLIVSIVMSYKAGGSYDKGCIDGYNAACDKMYVKFKASLDTLSAEYNEAIYRCNEARDLYKAKLEALNNELNEK